MTDRICSRPHTHFKPQSNNTTLSRVAAFGNLTKEDRCSYQFNERNYYEDTQRIESEADGDETPQQPNEIWDKADNGFFVMGGCPYAIPREIFHMIMSFIPAFPYYFMLRSVCHQWFDEFRKHIYAKVTYLSLIDDGRPKYYIRLDNDGQKTLVQFKPIGFIGEHCRLSTIDVQALYDDKTHLFTFLANTFPNVNHLRLGFGSLGTTNFNRCVVAMLPKLLQLETLDILGTGSRYDMYSKYELENQMEWSQWELIATWLPSSTKNLHFVGVTVGYSTDLKVLEMLKIFSDKGRQLINESLYRPTHSPIVDIHNFSFSCVFLPRNQLTSNDWESLRDIYSHFYVSVVGPPSNNAYSSNQSVFSNVQVCDYLNYMSKKEGIVLSLIRSVRKTTDEIMEAMIDIAVREHPYFQPLLSLPVTDKEFQLGPHSKLDAQFVLSTSRKRLPTILALITDEGRVKYPELVFHIDSTYVEQEDSPPGTLLSGLIAQCSREQDLNMIERIIETYNPSMVVDGVRNYLVEAFFALPDSSILTGLMECLLQKKPELVTMGNLDGLIDDNQRDLPLIQLFFESIDCLKDRSRITESLEPIKYLISAGASLTQVDRAGNNVLHSAFSMVDIDLVKYLCSVCPESFMFERNTMAQTPLELIFLNSVREFDFPSFLEEVIKLSCFKKQTLKDYQTSCGNLLHASLVRPNVQTIQWLLKNGFNANSLNEKRENALFHFAVRKQDKFEAACFVELIAAGAQVDLENDEGETILTSALRKKNYALISTLIHTPSVLSAQWSNLLAPRMKHGLTALHFIVRDMIEIEDGDSPEEGDYPVAKCCAILCLKHHPEMLYERAEESNEVDLKDICGVSPLQILLDLIVGYTC